MNDPQKSTSQREEEIFFAALEKTTPAERAAFLDGACGKEPVLRQRMEALLAKHYAHDSFMKAPAVVPAAEAQTVIDPNAPPLLAAAPITEGTGTLIGRYKLLQRIGEGGCGVVYMAEQSEPVRRRVALKVIKLGMDTNSVIARFEAERQALALMDHPNIAKVLDGGATEAGRPYFVMELVRGIKITEYCDQHNLPTRDRLDLFIKVCQAIQHAHQKGIIHRDIKPSNILVTLHDGVPVPKVIDFGIAKATTDQRLTDKTLFTALEQFIGTPAYMSPEQAEMSGLDIDTRCDIYSLGVLLYEILTGKTPFDAKELLASGLDEMRRTIREQEPVRPSTRLSTMLKGELTTTARQRQSEALKLIHLLRGDVDWIVMKCLEKDRARRYDTAHGLAADIKRFLTNEPVMARPPSTAYRFQKAFRRHKLAFAAGAAIGLALLAGTVVSSWQATVATRARAQALMAQHAAETARGAEQDQRMAAQKERDKAMNAQKLAETERVRSEQMRIATQRHLYITTMNLTQAAWEQNNGSRVRQLLEETASAPERGFEWYYWQRQTHLELRSLRGHGGPILAVAYSPDGRRIATGSADATARVWDAADGEELLPFRGHSAPIASVAFSPDGRRIVTGSWDQTVKLWDVATGTNLITFEGHGAAVFSVAFSPNGRQIVSGGWDRTAKVWDAAAGTNLMTLHGHSNGVLAVAFSPDGRRIVTGGWDRTAKVWDVATGNNLITFEEHNAPVFSVAFSPNGQRIVSGGWDHTAKVWQAASGSNLITLKGHSAPIFSVGFSLDGQRIITGGDDQTARVWDAANGEELFALKGHGSQISSVAFSPDGQQIVTGGGSVGLSPDGQFFDPGPGDQTAKVWQAAADKGVLTLEGHRAAVCSVAFSQDGQLLASSSFDGTAKVWEVARGKALLTLTNHSAAIRSVAFSPNGRTIVTASWDKTAKVWKIPSGAELLTLTNHSAYIFSAVFSPDGQRIATGSWDNTVRVWEAATGKQLLIFRGHGALVFPVVFSIDGRWIISASQDQTVKGWDAATTNELFTLREPHTQKIWSVAFSQDGQRFVTGSDDHTAKVWEAANHRGLVTLKGHSKTVFSVAFSPDGQRVVTGSADQTAKVWDAVSGRELLTLKGHRGRIFSVAFSSDGQRIVTGSDDRTIKVWEAASAEQVAIWQKQERAVAQSVVAQQPEQGASTEPAR